MEKDNEISIINFIAKLKQELTILEEAAIYKDTYEQFQFKWNVLYQEL